MSDWIGRVTVLLEPLADLIRPIVRQGVAIFADDTPVKIQAPGHKKIKTARVWAHVRCKFVDIFSAQGSATAEETIKRITRLDAVEQEARVKSPKERAALRQAQAKPRASTRSPAGVTLPNQRNMSCCHPIGRNQRTGTLNGPAP